MSLRQINPEALVAAIHSQRASVVLAATGGGSRAIAELLGVPGASRTLLEAVVPYASAALAAWLGSRPERFCSARTARAMAMVGFDRARRFARADGYPDPDGVAGVACTASLASDRVKRGEHRAHLALQSAARTLACSIVLVRDRRTRAEEEEVISRALLNLIAEHAGLEARAPSGLQSDEPVERIETRAPDDWRELLLGARQVVAATPAARTSEPTSPGRVVFPGAFNPLHIGHRRMAEIAAAEIGRPCEFEISIRNVDKPALDYTEIAERLTRFSRDEAVWLTDAAHFVDKVAVFPGAVFVVGVDTIRRLGDPRYAGGEARLEQQLRTLAEQGTSFLVFGRKLGETFTGLSNLTLPPLLAGMCREVPQARFREDISSTELRLCEGM
ncbi:MAG: hypothetical protein K1X74_14505 [Pirellulales bacterium]|nr:hypothetical protein [Pirellulales bacterium]